VATREKLSNTGGSKSRLILPLCHGCSPCAALQYSDIEGLERSIDTAYQIASRRLFDIFFEKYGLLHHLRALKQYLLLGHGDFADQLMESLGYVIRRICYAIVT
jgi:gamma-tubulin complex component 3